MYNSSNSISLSKGISMKRIIHYGIILALAHTTNSFCMFSRAYSTLSSKRIYLNNHRWHKSVTKKTNYLQNLRTQRRALESSCFGHGGLMDLMSLGPDEGLQEQYKKNMTKIAELKKLEARHLKKK
jgi:hypothetical protein